jgi:hypothetical protein
MHCCSIRDRWFRIRRSSKRVYPCSALITLLASKMPKLSTLMASGRFIYPDAEVGTGHDGTDEKTTLPCLSFNCTGQPGCDVRINSNLDVLMYVMSARYILLPSSSSSWWNPRRSLMPTVLGVPAESTSAAERRMHASSQHKFWGSTRRRPTWI